MQIGVSPFEKSVFFRHPPNDTGGRPQRLPGQPPKERWSRYFLALFLFLGRFFPLLPRQILPRLLRRSPLPIAFTSLLRDGNPLWCSILVADTCARSRVTTKRAGYRAFNIPIIVPEQPLEKSGVVASWPAGAMVLIRTCFRGRAMTSMAFPWWQIAFAAFAHDLRPSIARVFGIHRRISQCRADIDRPSLQRPIRPRWLARIEFCLNIFFDLSRHQPRLRGAENA